MKSGEILPIELIEFLTVTVLGNRAPVLVDLPAFKVVQTSKDYSIPLEIEDPEEDKVRVTVTIEPSHGNLFMRVITTGYAIDI